MGKSGRRSYGFPYDATFLRLPIGTNGAVGRYNVVKSAILGDNRTNSRSSCGTSNVVVDAP